MESAQFTYKAIVNNGDLISRFYGGYAMGNSYTSNG